MTAYQSLTPRQQRVWDAAYGAEFVRMYHQLDDLQIRQPELAAGTTARHLAGLAAASLKENGET